MPQVFLPDNPVYKNLKLWILDRNDPTDTMKIRNREVAKICELQVHFTTYMVVSLADLLFPVSQEFVKIFHIKQLSHKKDLKNPEKIYRTRPRTKGRGWFLNFLGAPMIFLNAK